MTISTKIFKFNNIYWLWMTLAMIVIITTLSLLPVNELPKVVGTDKIHHFIGYFLFALPVCFAKPKNWQLLCCFLVLFSGLIEIIQPYMSRYGEWLDFAANSLGIFFAILISSLIQTISSLKN